MSGVQRESPVAVAASWVTLAASFALSFTTRLALGDLAGYGGLAFAMALCVDGYIVTAPAPAPAPAAPAPARGERQPAPAASIVVTRVRPLVAEGLGHTAIVTRLGITAHQARQAIDAIKAEKTVHCTL